MNWKDWSPPDNLEEIVREVAEKIRQVGKKPASGNFYLPACNCPRCTVV